MYLNFIRKIPINNRWKIALKTLPYVVFLLLLKFIIHELKYEFLDLNPLFTAIISANIFLIGFLITGVLADYKESEKLPGELAASIETMTDEGLILYENKKSPEAKAFIKSLIELNDDMIAWFYKKINTDTLHQKIRSLNHHFLAFESLTQPNFITRLKQEQHHIRRIVKRVHTIRETNFLGTGYAITEIITVILATGLIFIKIDPFYESAFFVVFISFILVYMVFFIKDLDNPFGYAIEENMVEEVSLKPILDSRKRIEKYFETMK